MRRVMLLIIGVGAGGVLLLFLSTGMVRQYGVVQAAQFQNSFPCSVEGADLVAVQLVNYEGPYWEDESGEEVAGVAALLVENTSGLVASKGTVILIQGGEKLVFSFSCLPPESKGLILEQSRAPYRQGKITACYGWMYGAYPERTGAIWAGPAVCGKMAVINRSDSPFSSVAVYFKNYDAESGIFIGGVTHKVEVNALQPREIRLLLPYRYAVGYSKVVEVAVDDT